MSANIQPSDSSFDYSIKGSPAALKRAATTSSMQSASVAPQSSVSSTNTDVNLDVVKVYEEAFATLVALANKTTPYTEEDYQALLDVMKQLEALLEMPPPPAGPNLEMQYNINVVLSALYAAGITSDGTCEDPLAAINSLQNAGIKVLPWGSNPGEEVPLSEFLADATNAAYSSHGTQWLLTNILANDILPYFRGEITTLAIQLKAVMEVIEALTVLTNLTNEIQYDIQEEFTYPLENSAQLPEQGSEGYNKIVEAMESEDGDYEGSISAYEDLDWSEAFVQAMKDDVAAAEAAMKADPTLTMEEAMAQQNNASTVLMEYMHSDDVTESSASTIMDALLTAHFEVEVSVTESTEALNEIWDSVMAARDTLEKALNALDPIPEPMPEGYVPLREQPNTLPYFIEQVINDIDSITGSTDAEKAYNWIMACQAGEDGTSSTFMNHINQAISAATSMSTDTKMELQMMMMLFQNLLSMWANIQKQISQIIVSTAQKISR